MKSDMKRKYV